MNTNYHVGVAAVIECLGHASPTFLLGKRSGGRGNGEWALIGGKVEADETLAEGIAREVREEVGLNKRPEDYRLLFSREERIEGSAKRSLTFYYHIQISPTDVLSVVNCEPDTHSELKWFKADHADDRELPKIWKSGNAAIAAVFDLSLDPQPSQEKQVEVSDSLHVAYNHDSCNVMLSDEFGARICVSFKTLMAAVHEVKKLEDHAWIHGTDPDSTVLPDM